MNFPFSALETFCLVVALIPATTAQLLMVPGPSILQPVEPNDCQDFLWPKRGNEPRLLWYEQGHGAGNAEQFCKEQGFSNVQYIIPDKKCEHTGGDDNDESGYSDWDGSSWVYKPTPSANRCYVMIKAIRCCDACKKFDWPTRLSELMWYEGGLAQTNGDQFCREEGFGITGYIEPDSDCEHNDGDDNDESSYANWDGSSWVMKNTPSANRCYVMIKSIYCCPYDTSLPLCVTFTDPRRLDDQEIWAEPPEEGCANKERFCEEEGFDFVQASSIAYPCDDNDESSFATWNGDEWENRDSGSANRCYLMWDSITCCHYER